MTEHIIELQDHGIRISRPGEVLATSPGFANIAHASPVFGEEARRQYRLHPRQSFNQFWSQLSLDPLANTNNHFRHQADLAYGHLNSLAAAVDLQGDALFAVPSNYNRNQLAILLGLVRQLPFEAAGLVDLALAASLDAARREISVYLDIQLHQSVLTRLVLEGGQLRRDSVLQIPGSGLLALQEGWATMLRDAFIKQSRFDPLHNAETEQYLFNRLGDWLAEAAANNEVLMEINHKGSVHQAKVNRGFFEQKARNVFTRIRQELEALGGADADFLLPAGMAALPGLDLYVPGLRSVDDEAAAANAFAAVEQIRGEPGALSFVTSLPARGSAASRPARPDDPSHVLVNHRAYRLPAGGLCIGPRGQAPADGGVSFIEVDDPALSRPITISRSDEGYVLEGGPNGASAGEPRALRLGDRIRLADSDIDIQLIQVE